MFFSLLFYYLFNISSIFLLIFTFLLTISIGVSTIAIIPVNNSLKVKLDKSVISQAISRIGIACNPLTRRIKTTFNENKLSIKAEDATTSSKAEETLNIEYDAEEMVIGFNSTKILDIFKNVETDYIEMNIGSSIKPVIIKPYESNDSYELLMLVMPIKVSE